MKLKHRINKLPEDINLLNEDLIQLSELMTLDNFVGGEINTGNVIINKNIIETNNIYVGKQEVVVAPGDDIQEKIDLVATDGGKVSIRNGYYAVTDDINIPSGVYVYGETSGSVVLDFLDNTHGVKLVGENEYTTGDVTIATGESTVVGTDTLWATNIAAGQYIYLGQSWCLITEVVSDTELTIELPYIWDSLTNSSYVVASTVVDSVVGYMTIMNADSGVKFQYTSQCFLDTVNIVLSNIGIEFDYTANATIRSGQAISCGYGFYCTDSSLIDTTAVGTIGCLGDGVSLDGCKNIGFINLFSIGNTANGVNLYDCDNIPISGPIQYNGSDGILIDNSTDCSFVSGVAEYNTANGVTIENSTNIGVNLSGINYNGSYGIAIDADCVTDMIIGNSFNSNGTASILNLGTGTSITGNTGTVNDSLDKTNTTAFTPTGDYQPATKKYVDDTAQDAGGYTDEMAQDAVGGILDDGSVGNVTFTYDDAGGVISAIVPNITWSIVTEDGNLTINTGTLANKGTLLTLTLPATAVVGSVVRVNGMNAGLWKIAQNANGVIHFGNANTTTGVSGYISSTLTYDAVELVCTVANNEWVVVSSVGNITVA
jgi:hypothetical protein